MKPKSIVFSFVSVVCLLVSFTMSTRAAERLTLYGGMTVYPNPEYDSMSLVEFSFSLNRHELEFYQPMTTDSLYYARVFAQLDLFGTRGAAVDSAATLFSLRVKDRSEALKTGIRVFNKVSIFIPPGIYSARLTVIDAASKKKGECFYNSFNVLPPVKNRVALSNVCLAYSVSSVTDTMNINRRLMKNGFYIIPNPISTFGSDDSAVYLYAEAYNLSFEPADDHRVEFSLAVLMRDSSLFRSLGTRSASTTGKTAVVVDSIDIAGWPADIYITRLIVRDISTSLADTAFGPFQIISVDELAKRREERSGFDPYDTMSVESRVRLVTYLLTPHEKQTLARLGDSARITYLDQYWKEHDEFPETPEIENRLDLIQRFEDANRLYSTNHAKNNGWNSHMGRILMQYGRPSYIEDKTAEWVNSLPMQIWYYWEREQGKFFLFADQYHDFDFRLVHSNVDGEIYDKNWQQALDAGWIEIGKTPFSTD